MDKWKELLELRGRVNEKLEQARQAKLIGKSLEACVTITSPACQKLKTEIALPELAEFFIVSKVNLVHGDTETISVEPASSTGMKKCIRCWKFHDELGSNAAHPELCVRCTSVVAG
jgi:isoleucyl-tRNA synthetase